MFGSKVTSMTGYACDALEDTRHQLAAVSVCKALQGPPGVFLKTHLQKPEDTMKPGKSMLEREKELQSTKAPLPAPPGIFTQPSAAKSNVSVSSKIAPPPGVFAALPCLHITKQQEKEAQQCSESKAPLGPPPGVFVPTSTDLHVNLDVAKSDQESTRCTIELPPDFRAPPGLDHMVDISCYRQSNPSKLSRAPSEDDLSTVAGSSFLSSSADDMEEIISEDEASGTERTKLRPAAESCASVELQLDDLVYADGVGNTGADKASAMHMPPIPFVSAVAVQMAWQQWYAGAAMTGKLNRRQRKA